MPYGAAETGRAVLEETAGRAAAHVVRGAGRAPRPSCPRGQRHRDSGLLPMTPLNVVSRVGDVGDVITTSRGVKIANALRCRPSGTRHAVPWGSRATICCDGGSRDRAGGEAPSHEPAGGRDQSVPAPARAQPGRLVSVGSGGADA